MAYQTSYTGADVLDNSAALLNDPSKTLYTYAIMLPYLKMALSELDQQLTLIGEPRLRSWVEVTVSVGTTIIADYHTPTNFYVPIKLQERTPGDASYTPMTEVDDVFTMGLILADTLRYWDFRNNNVRVFGSTITKQILMEYWGLDVLIADQTSTIYVKYAPNFLAYRVASHCARYIGGNSARADALAMEAAMAIDTLLSLAAKNTQGIRKRRKPFRAGGSTIKVTIP